MSVEVSGSAKPRSYSAPGYPELSIEAEFFPGTLTKNPGALGGLGVYGVFRRHLDFVFLPRLYGDLAVVVAHGNHRPRRHVEGFLHAVRIGRRSRCQQQHSAHHPPGGSGQHVLESISRVH
jgi:hypothetical protein